VAPRNAEIDLEPFDRVVLVFAVVASPTGEISPSRLVALAPGPRRADQVAASIVRLEKAGLVTIHVVAPPRVKYARTRLGIEEAERLLRDGRVSFKRAIRSRREAPPENLL